MTASLSEWVGAAPSFFVALFVLLVPGILAGAALRLKGMFLWGAAPALSFGIYGVAAVVLGWLGQPWNVWQVSISVAISVILAYCVGRLAKRMGRGWGDDYRPPERHEKIWAVPLALLLGGGTILATLIRGIGSPENFSQEYDNTFHLNAVRYILDTGDASSLSVSHLISGDTAPTVYPAAWHAGVALVVELSGVSIPLATNVFSFAVCLAAWVVGAIVLGRTLFGSSSSVTIASGIISASIPAFPYLFFDWGPLYPLLAGLSFVPIAIALYAHVLRLSACDANGTGRFTSSLVLVGVCVGMTFAHPSVAVLFVFICALMASQKAYDVLRLGCRTVKRKYILVGLFVSWALALGAWWKIRPAYEASNWQASQTVAQAVGEVLLNAPMLQPSALLLAIFVFIGAVVAWHSERFWLVALHVWSALLFIAASAYQDGILRTFLTGVFYRDSHRLGGILAVTALPLGVLGMATVWRYLQRHIGERAQAFKREHLSLGKVSIGVITTFCVLSIILFQWRVVQFMVIGIRTQFQLTGTSKILTVDERRVLEILPLYVDRDATIIVDPATGAAFAYALEDIRVTGAHSIYAPTYDVVTIIHFLDDPAHRDDVCQAVEELDAYYILDFGGEDIYTNQDHSGLEDLTGADFEKLYQSGDARLLKFVGCNES